jgi:magnesium chelatase family protein
MEDAIITISRAKGTVTYPAQFLLVAASNPCPCGYFGDPKKPCRCLPGMVSRYQKRVSGPILDRIDIHIDVPSVETQKLIESPSGSDDPMGRRQNSKKIQEKVQRARDIQTKRFKGMNPPAGKAGIRSNSEMGTKDVKKYCVLNSACRTMMVTASSAMNLTARSFFKVVKIARTIADLEGAKEISTNHLAEALQYRPKEYDL